VEGSDFLFGIAEVAAAFAGFSSIVAVFGRSARGAWSPTARIRLRNLVEQSLLVVAFAFFPMAVVNLHFSPSTTWAISSAVLAFVLAFDLALWIKRAIELKKYGSLRVSMLMMGVGSIGAGILLQVANLSGWIFNNEAGPYMSGLLLLLVLAGLQFALLIFTPLGPED
jgi:hypothetical protein